MVESVPFHECVQDFNRSIWVVEIGRGYIDDRTGFECKKHQ